MLLEGSTHEVHAYIHDVVCGNTINKQTLISPDTQNALFRFYWENVEWSRTFKLLSEEKRGSVGEKASGNGVQSFVCLPLTPIVVHAGGQSQPVWPQRSGRLSVMQFDPSLMMSWHLLNGAPRLDGRRLIGSDRTAPVALWALRLPGKCGVTAKGGGGGPRWSAGESGFSLAAFFCTVKVVYCHTRRPVGKDLISAANR